MAMRLHIIARGKIGRSPEAELVNRYLKRISWPTKHSELPDVPDKGRGGDLPASDSPYKTIILDEKGAQLSSVELARLLERWRDDAGEPADHAAPEPVKPQPPPRAPLTPEALARNRELAGAALRHARAVLAEAKLSKPKAIA